MHGRVKTRTTAEQQEIKRKEREKKVKLYRAGIDKLFNKRQNGELDEEVLEISGQLLSANPDIYTLWSLRREVILNFKETRPEDAVQQFLEIELRLTEQCLRANPKSYGAWHHRSWVLETMPVPNWDRELTLCNKYLELDERNFHTWNYRQFVVQHSQVPAAEEFAYSTSKIITNFSNYSSWHYRSRLLPSIFPDPSGRRPIREDKHKEELELVQNAAFTDPNDQSAWFYQRWLLGRARQPLGLVRAHVSHSIVCAALTQSVRLSGSLRLELRVAGQVVHGEWRGTSQPDSHVWVFSPATELFQGDGLPAPVTVCLYSADQPTDSLQLHVEGGATHAWASNRAQFGAQFSEGLTYVLEDELASCQQLLELEPDSKWTMLTYVLLMQAIDRHKYRQETMEILSQLTDIDPLRTGYYKDLRSRYEMEYAIDALEEEKLEQLQQVLNLSNRNLTALYHCQYLSLLQQVDLSNNELSHSLPQLHALQCCQVLILDNNLYESLDGLPSLPSLHTLSLKNNYIKCDEDLKCLEHCRSTTSLDLCGNPVENDPRLIENARHLLPILSFLNGKSLE